MDCWNRRDICSATISQSLWLILFCSTLFLLTAFAPASPPAWWSSFGAVNTNTPNNYAVATQGQLKQFTQKAVQEMNTNVFNGAGSDLNGLISSWASDYATNGYSATNLKPSDLQA